MLRATTPLGIRKPLEHFRSSYRCRDLGIWQGLIGSWVGFASFVCRTPWHIKRCFRWQLQQQCVQNIPEKMIARITLDPSNLTALFDQHECRRIDDWTFQQNGQAIPQIHSTERSALSGLALAVDRAMSRSHAAHQGQPACRTIINSAASDDDEIHSMIAAAKINTDRIGRIGHAFQFSQFSIAHILLIECVIASF